MNQNYIPNPGQQEFALSIDDSVFEILYGGARTLTPRFNR